MPVVLTPVVSSAVYTVSNLQIAITGEAFAENQYTGVSKIEVSKDGSTWIEVTTYNSWADTALLGTFASALSGGTYTTRVTNSDGEIATLASSFTVSGGGSAGLFFFFSEGAKG